VKMEPRAGFEPDLLSNRLISKLYLCRSIDIGLPELTSMQTYDPVLTSIVVGFVGALAGGALTRLLIRALEVKEREREGAFNALLGLLLAKELVEIIPNDLPSENQKNRVENLRFDSVRLLINAAGTIEQNLREDLYLLAILIQEKLKIIHPTDTQKKRVLSNLENIEKRIKKAYFGSSLMAKEMVMTLENFLEYLESKL